MVPLPDASGDSLRAFLLDNVKEGAKVITDGWKSYPPIRDLYVHEPLEGASGADASNLLPGVHTVASLAKRWLLGTHQGRLDDAHLASYLNEFVFRFNRRRSRSRGLVFYRVLELAAAHEPIRYRDLILNPGRRTARPPLPPTSRGKPASLDRPPANRPWRAAHRSTPVRWISQYHGNPPLYPRASTDDHPRANQRTYRLQAFLAPVRSVRP